MGVFLITRMLGATAGGILSAPLLTRLEGFRVLSLVELFRGLITIAIIPLASPARSGRWWRWRAPRPCLSAATSPSAAGLIPEVLPGELVQAGNALHGVGRNLMFVIGAGLGGFLVARFGIGVAMSVDLVTFVAAGLLYWTYAAATGASEPEVVSERPGASRRELVQIMLSSRVVLGLTVSFTVATAAFGIFNVSLPQLFESQLGEPDAYGYALAMLGVGFLCSELLTGFMQRESVARRSIFLSFLTTAGLMFTISHSTVTATAFLVLFLVGATDGITEVVYDTLIQLHVRRDLRAGVFAVAESVQNLGMVAGMAAAPVLVSLYSAAAAVQFTAVGCLCGGVLAGVALIRRTSGSDLLYVPDHAAVETNRAAIGGPPGPRYRLRSPPLRSSPPSVPPLFRLWLPCWRRLPTGARARPTRADRGHGRHERRRWAARAGRAVGAQAVAAGDGRGQPRGTGADGDRPGRRPRCGGARAARGRSGHHGGQPDGAGHTFTCGLAFDTLSAECGGVFLIDRGCRLRLAFAATEPGEWIPASMVLSRLRRLSAA